MSKKRSVFEKNDRFSRFCYDSSFARSFASFQSFLKFLDVLKSSESLLSKFLVAVTCSSVNLVVADRNRCRISQISKNQLYWIIQNFVSCQLFFEFLDVLKNSESLLFVSFTNGGCSITFFVVADRNRLTKLGLFKNHNLTELSFVSFNILEFF